MFEDIRNSLLNEARLSPQLLSDLAGLENYVAESYDSRSFIELLQNADDAKSTSFLITKAGKYLIVANDGKLFTSADLEAICRSAASNKERGSNIGYRGIGFKSVVGLANEVHIISGSLQITFSRDLTSLEIPKANKVPLIRIPHPIDATAFTETNSEISRLQSQGYSTFFIFSGLTVNSIDHEFIEFDPSSLLFLKNIKKLQLNGTRVDNFDVSKESWDEVFSFCTLKSSTTQSNWVIASENSISIAFYQDPKTEKIETLSDVDAVVHAFLPTHEATGLGVKINGDISTDPSRTRVVFDERTRGEVEKIAKLASKILIRTLTDEPLPDTQGMLQALLPTDDPRLHKHQRQSFKSEIITAMKEECGSFIEKLSLKPSWLNQIDFDEISTVTQLKSAPRIVSDVSGATNYLRYLGAKEATITQLSSSIAAVSKISKVGCSEITSELVRLCDTKQIDPSSISQDLQIFYSAAGRTSIKDAKNKGLILDGDYLDLISERSSGTAGLARMIKSIAGLDAISTLLPKEKSDTNQNTVTNTTSELLDSLRSFELPGITKYKTLNLKKWRGAEEQLRNILEAEGWTALDVSRQNIGYDIECENHKGEKLFIEVKLIETPTQPFILTSNEEVVAREKGDSYVIAIMRQCGDSIEVSFIPNPAKNLELTRQCRQWVWECSSYPYTPKVYDLQQE